MATVSSRHLRATYARHGFGVEQRADGGDDLEERGLGAA